MSEQIADTGANQTSGTSQGAEGTQQTALTDASTSTQATTAAADGAKGADGQNKEGAQQQVATEGQGDKSQTNSEGDKGVAVEGAPEKYEFKAPEGVDLSQPVVSAFSEVAKELNLSQDAAQKVVDKVAPLMAKQSQEAFEQVNNAWLEATKSDKEFGGDKLNANLAVAKKALDAFGTPELRELLNKTGLGNNPEVIRAFYRAGKAMSEDSYVPGGKQPTAAAKRDAATALYGQTH